MDSGLPIKNTLALPCPSGGCGPAQLYPPTIYCFAVDGSNIYAGTNFGVFRSSDNALSWTAVNSGLNDAMVGSILVDGSNLIAGTNSGIFMLKNNNTNWTAVNSGLPANTNVNCLLVSGDNIFAGTWGGGVFLSTNNGTSWTAVDFGLSDLNVQCLAVSGSNIFAGTYNNGIWRMPLSDASVHQLKSAPGQHSLKLHSAVNRIDQNMTIEFSLPQGDRVALNIYNLSGKRTATLVNDYLDAGSHSLFWDTRDLASGCYIVRMQTSTFVEGQRIELIR
jgi:hypothetical protein